MGNYFHSVELNADICCGCTNCLKRCPTEAIRVHGGKAREPKLALVLGTEGDGLADGTITNCDYTVKIPMTHGVDSLNVAAASAVAFFQLGNN